jgi:hypothetical protein
MAAMKWMLAAALILLNAGAASAQLSGDAQRAADAYRTAVLAAEVGGAGRIERAFEALTAVRDTLLQGTQLQSLNDAAFVRLVSQLRGVIISRRETQFVQPDVTYYAHLANTKGDAADKAFFTALKATYPDSIWPVYLQRQTDTGGCTRFGSLSLVETYGVWAQFKQRFPTRYQDAVSDETEAIFELLTDGTCACGSIPDVVRELTAFNTRFSSSPVTTEVESRLRDLAAGPSGIRASCRAQ